MEAEGGTPTKNPVLQPKKRPLKAKKKKKDRIWTNTKEHDDEIEKLKNHFVKGNRNSKNGRNKLASLNGPVITICGDRTNAANETISNIKNGQPEREDTRANNKPSRIFDIPKLRGRTSEPSKSKAINKWDASEIDETWVCVFCGNFHNTHGLGDLFGPYYLKCGPNFQLIIPKHVNEANPICKQKSNSKQQTNKLQDTPPTTQPPKKGKSKGKGKADSQVPDIEFWVHQDCLIWSEGVSWVPGETIRGLQEAVVSAQNVVCNFCGQIGANVGCIFRGCRQVFHYLCARDLDCDLNNEFFTISCTDHSKKHQSPSIS